MSKYSMQVAASLLALVLAGVLVFRIEGQKNDFDAAVKKAHQQSAGYDEKFAEMVDRVEDLLAERASFGYAGNRDPMTGTTRIVAARPQVTPRQGTARRTASAATATAVENEAVQVVEEVDPVRLTAIIRDDVRNIYTAIVMDGTRSLSVSPGDVVINRRVTRITNDEIHMESTTARYIYNIMGGSTKIPK
jgi:hypothetical protein